MLKALQEKLLNQELFAEFCDEFTREMNRLWMERRANLSSAKRGRADQHANQEALGPNVGRRDRGGRAKAEIEALDVRRKELQKKLENADEPPPLLHPEMARIYRSKVMELAKALQEPESRIEATEALRGLVDAIVLTPAAGTEELAIELRGNLAAMLGATVPRKRPPESDDLSLQLALVAGARNQRYLQLWSGAA